MNTSFYTRITQGKAAKSFREGNKAFVLKHPEHMDELTKIAFTVADKNHHKAFWALELICEEDCSYFEPFIDDFCRYIPAYKNDNSKRPVSRICMFLVNSKKIQLTKEQKLMLEMSEVDLQHGRIITHNDLDKNDLEWLKGQ